MKSLVKTLALAVFILFIGIFSSYRLGISDNKLSKEEVQSLLFMLEEEKLAFDVYTKMDEKWGTRQFNHIKNSEIMHMDAVKEILDNNGVKYQLLEAGKFNDQKLQNLYNTLISKGNSSETDALNVGATIEDVDIFDLIRLKKETRNADIIRTYNFLECGSRNHLRAFTRGLKSNNANYKPEYISQKEYENILNNEQERCGQVFGMGGNQGKGMGKGNGKMNCNARNIGNYGQKAETGDVEGCCGSCE